MNMSSVKPDLEPAAGFSLESRPTRPDRVPLAKGQYSIASRALALSTYFLSGALAINISQFLGSPLALINQDWYNAWIAFTKQSFGLLTMSLTQTFAPTKVIVSGNESVRGQLLKSVEGDLLLDFPERIILVSNHQIYTDWLYLWWIAYCNGMHGRLYIILKESLKKIPVLGWGMQLSQFIFLKRKWEEDRPNMASALQRLNKPTDPMWLLLFPEGTNLAPSTRAKSAAWAKKNNIPDTRHVLLPRSTGLHFCLEELGDSVDYVYDCTVAYEGVPRGQYAQDIFTLKAGYLEGRPPKSVSMHWRRFAVKDIPLHNDKAFELWLTARWREKDLLMEQYYQNGHFPADTGATKYKSGKVVRGCGHMEVPIRANRWYEFLQIFAPMGILAMVLYVFYGDLPQKVWKSINQQALQSGTEDFKKAGLQAGRQAKSVSTSFSGLSLDSFFEPTQQQETFKAGAMAVQKLVNSPSAQKVLNRADFIQQFLSDPQKTVADTMTEKQQNFMQDLAMEEARRQQSRISDTMTTSGILRPITHGTTVTKGTFWTELESEKKSRHGSIVSAPSSTATKQSKGTFWQDVKAVEDKKSAAAKGTFWDDMKAEQNNRYGTVVTLSSNASTAVASNSSRSTNGSVAKPTPVKAPSSIGPGTTKNPPLLKVATQKTPATASGETQKPKPTVRGTLGAPKAAAAKKPSGISATKQSTKPVEPPATATRVKAATTSSSPPTLSKLKSKASTKPAPKLNTPKPPVVGKGTPKQPTPKPKPLLETKLSSTSATRPSPKKLPAVSNGVNVASATKTTSAKTPPAKASSTEKTSGAPKSAASRVTNATPKLNGGVKGSTKSSTKAMGPPKLKT